MFNLENMLILAWSSLEIWVSAYSFFETFCVAYLGNFDAHIVYYSNYINLNELVNVSPLAGSPLPS